MDLGTLDEDPRPEPHAVFAAAAFGLKRWRERLGDLRPRREEVPAVNAITGLIDKLIKALAALEARNDPEGDDGHGWGGRRLGAGKRRHVEENKQ